MSSDKFYHICDIAEFMEYLTKEVYKVERAYSLGIRIRSLPLAIQVMPCFFVKYFVVLFNLAVYVFTVYVDHDPYTG